MLNVTAWLPGAPDFIYPELASPIRDYLLAKDDFGIAFAGGGARGAANAHGAARALREAGILDRARYAVVSSGSAWFGAPLYYQTADSLDELLGRSLPPEQLSESNLTGAATGGTFVSRLSWPISRLPKKQMSAEAGAVEESNAEGHVGGSLRSKLTEAAATLAKAVEEVVEWKEWPEIGQLLRDVWSCLEDLCVCASRESPLHQAWNLLIGFTFLRPFGLAERDAVHCHATELEHVRQRLGPRARVFSAEDASRNLPFLLSQASVLAPFTNSSVPVTAFPLEGSALYSGIPVGLTGAEAAPYTALGGVLVEPLAASSAATGPVHLNAGEHGRGVVQVERKLDSLNLGSIAEWAGVITAYAADFQTRDWSASLGRCETAAMEAILPQRTLWSPLLVDDGGVPRARALPVGDAGIYDDIGHLPLLRRRVKIAHLRLRCDPHQPERGANDRPPRDGLPARCLWAS